MEAARRNGLLIGKGGLYGNVIRVSPPPNIGKPRYSMNLPGFLDASLLRSCAYFSESVGIAIHAMI